VILNRFRCKRSAIAIVATGLIGFSTLFTGAANSAGGTSGTIDYAYFTAMGWTPGANSLPNLACRDGAYSRAVSSGIKLGVYQAAPYMYTGKDGKMTGIDYDINLAVLKYIGITKHTDVALQWPAMVPALLSKRIDVIAGNIHENPTRLKSIAFTTPAWWYGGGLIVNKDNSKNVQTWADLQKSGVKVGSINGSFSATYLAGLTNPKVDLTVFENADTEFLGLLAGKVDVLLEDGPKVGAYNVANPSAKFKILTKAIAPAAFITADGEYAMRPADCTLIGAYSRALQELRDHGIVTFILAKYGLSSDALYMPQYLP
jgi:polar amino acid transport system substrate-binding protein